MNRRHFLKIAGKAAVALPLIGNMGNCKKDSPTGPDVPKEIKLNLYNHTQGYIKSITKTVTEVSLANPLFLNISVVKLLNKRRFDSLSNRNS